MKYLTLTFDFVECNYHDVLQVYFVEGNTHIWKKECYFSGWGPLNPIVCDHFRATKYFIESLSPKSTHVMKGFPCTDVDGFDRGRCLNCNGACPVMGYDAVQSGNRQIQGRHYLYTAGSAPFCGN